MKKWDLWIVVIIVCVAGSLYFFGMFQPKNQGGEAVVYVGGTEKIRLSLQNNREFLVETPEGYNLVVIKDGTVAVAEADCRDEICVNHKAISLVKESITCLPHKMIIEIQNTKESDIDAIAQ